MYAKTPLEDPDLLQMTVQRKEDGLHVVLPSAKTCTPELLIASMDILPIASITVGTDKWSPGLRTDWENENERVPQNRAD